MKSSVVVNISGSEVDVNASVDVVVSCSVDWEYNSTEWSISNVEGAAVVELVSPVWTSFFVVCSVDEERNIVDFVFEYADVAVLKKDVEISSSLGDGVLVTSAARPSSLKWCVVVVKDVVLKFSDSVENSSKVDVNMSVDVDDSCSGLDFE